MIAQIVERAATSLSFTSLYLILHLSTPKLKLTSSNLLFYLLSTVYPPPSLLPTSLSYLVPSIITPAQQKQRRSTQSTQLVHNFESYTI